MAGKAYQRDVEEVGDSEHVTIAAVAAAARCRSSSRHAAPPASFIRHALAKHGVQSCLRTAAVEVGSGRE
jgi:hypothetical protein